MHLVRYLAPISLALVFAIGCSNSDSPGTGDGGADASAGGDSSAGDASADAADASGDTGVADASGDTGAGDAGCTPANCVSPLACCPSNGRCYNPACLACCM